ncbi:MAG: substrate-binding domain-containing protein [Desulfobacterales bacterium]
MNSKKYGQMLLLACALMLMAVPSISGQQALVICNSSVPHDSLSSSDIQQIFLGRKTRWSDNQKISFVLIKEGDVHAEFLKTYLSRTPSQYQAFWRKMVFTGQSGLPTSFNTPEEVIKYVAGTPGAIGYVPAGLPHDKVKVVATIPAN